MIINYLGIFGVLENIVIMISVSALARRSATLVSEGEPDLIVDHLNTGIHWPPAPYQICPEVIARRCAVSAPTLREFSIYIALPYGADGPASASWGWQVEQGEHGVKMTPGFGKYVNAPPSSLCYRRQTPDNAYTGSSMNILQTYKA